MANTHSSETEHQLPDRRTAIKLFTAIALSLVTGLGADSASADKLKTTTAPTPAQDGTLSGQDFSLSPEESSHTSPDTREACPTYYVDAHVEDVKIGMLQGISGTVVWKSTTLEMSGRYSIGPIYVTSSNPETGEKSHNSKYGVQGTGVIQHRDWIKHVTLTLNITAGFRQDTFFDEKRPFIEVNDSTITDWGDWFFCSD